MGNVNNCLSNPFEYEEITIRPQQNIITDKTVKNSKKKDFKSRSNLYNRQKLDIINEEEEQEPRMYIDKQKDSSMISMNNSKRDNSSIISVPKDIKIMENKFNQKFNNDIKTNNNNNQNFMILDNNVLFNVTRKSNNSPKNLDNSKYQNNKDNNINNSDNNFETNKLINSEEDSDNLIVLEYNKPESSNLNINVNNINGYSNSDNFISNDKQLNNIDNNINIENSNDFNSNRLLKNTYKTNSNDNLNRNNNNYIFNNISNSNIIENEDEPKDNIINNTRKKDNNVKRQLPPKYSSSLINSNTPYKKPRFNPNYNNNCSIENKNNNYMNKKNMILNQKKENQNLPNINNNNFYYNNKKKTLIESSKINQINNEDVKNNNNKFENNINIDTSNNRFTNNIILREKYNTQNIQNSFKNEQNYNSRKPNSDPYYDQMTTQRQYIQNPPKIDDLIKYNRTNIANKNNIDNNEINDCQILKNNKTNPELNKQIIDNKKNINIFTSKTQDLIQSNNQILNNNEENMIPDERVLYQSAISDNVHEDDVLYNSALAENNDLNYLNQQKIISPISQNNLKNEHYEIGQTYEFSQPNEKFIYKEPINRKEYDYNSIITQQKEQEKKNPEYEQTQSAEEDGNEINEFQQKIISQYEQKEPRDKDSESEIDPKMQEQQPLPEEFQEIKKYINNNNLLPISNDRITFKKDDNINDNNQNNNEQEFNNININKKKCKAKINSSEISKNENDENILGDKESFSEESQFYALPLTPIKPTDEETPYIKGYINKIKVNNDAKDIDNNFQQMNNSDEKNFDNNIQQINDSDEKNLDNNENNYTEELECEEFKDFSPDSWEKFYSKEERFFKFPKEDIIKDQIIINNQEIYKGDINRDKKKHGFGKFISPTIKRIGTWRNDIFMGWCREINANGELYEGKFVNGKLTGKGIYKNKNNKSTYIGDFENSMRHGKGELFTNDFHYKGDFRNNKLNGKGKIEIYKEGEYEGTFKDNQFEGKGMLKWKDGKYYIGEVSKGKMNGYGEEIFSDGNRYKGHFVDGVKDGRGKLFTPDGTIIELNYKNGILVNNNNVEINNNIIKNVYD